MQYEMEELVPIVAGLAGNYVSKESTSITYERAEKLMEAVIYCINEAGQAESFLPASEKKIPPKEMYVIGAKCVEEKTKKALKLYNGIMLNFQSFSNRCLYDTMVKGMPEFFKWYDCVYEPQNTILTLDYPILTDISQRTGIDAVYEYLKCIRLEQRFLGGFEPEYVTRILEEYDRNYGLIIENICEIVLSYAYVHSRTDSQQGACDISSFVYELVKKHYENDRELSQYLHTAAENISVRLKVR